MLRFWTFVGCIALAFVPALGGMLSRPDDWYAALVKPPLQPPAWIFAPVWTLLYLMMGVAHGIYSINSRSGEGGRVRGLERGHAFYLAQLALNAAWSPLFFAARLPLAAALEIMVLLVMILLTLRTFALRSRTAAFLLVPYACWVTFAAYLNWGIVWLNR